MITGTFVLVVADEDELDICAILNLASFVGEEGCALADLAFLAPHTAEASRSVRNS
jgi:hypothetical protein